MTYTTSIRCEDCTDTGDSYGCFDGLEDHLGDYGTRADAIAAGEKHLQECDVGPWYCVVRDGDYLTQYDSRYPDHYPEDEPA